MANTFTPLRAAAAAAGLAAGVFGLTTTAHAVNFACLVDPIGGCGVYAKPKPEEPPDCASVANATLAADSLKDVLFVVNGGQGWRSIIERDPIVRLTLATIGCKGNGWTTYLLQGASPETGAVTEIVGFANASATTHWRYANAMIFTNKPIETRAESIGMDLPHYTKSANPQFDPAVKLPHSINYYVGYSTTNLAALRGQPKPPPGERVIVYSASSLPGGCLQSVRGGSNFVLPARSAKQCNGAAHRITAKSICTLRTEGGNSEVGIAPLAGAGALVRGPLVQVGTQPTQIKLSEHLRGIGSKGPAAWFYNDSANAVQIECAG